MSPDPRKAAILISGSGTNLQSFIDRVSDQLLNLEIVVVISNRADAYGLERARAADIDAVSISHTEFAERQSFDQALAAEIDKRHAGLVILAGFMRILSPWFVRHYESRVLNIHPALLPAYPGLDTHQRVLDSGDAWHGSTVHFVTDELDGGPRIVQGRLRVDPNENADQLCTRVQSIEHQIYPEAASWFGSGRLRFKDGKAWLDEKELVEPVLMDFDQSRGRDVLRPK